VHPYLVHPIGIRTTPVLLPSPLRLGRFEYIKCQTCPFLPSKLPLHVWGPGLPSSAWFLRPTRVKIQNDHFGRFWRAQSRDRQTQHATPAVATCHIQLLLWCSLKTRNWHKGHSLTSIGSQLVKQEKMTFFHWVTALRSLQCFDAAGRAASLQTSCSNHI